MKKKSMKGGKNKRKISLIFFFFFFNGHCNPCGFWHAQLSLSILSRKVFTECRCQRHVKPPNLEDQPVIRTFQLPPPGVPHVWHDASEPQVELWARNCREFCRKWRLPCHFWVLLHAVNFTTWDRRIYFPSEGSRAEDFFARKIRRLRPGLNPRTWVPEASRRTSIPPKPLCLIFL